MFKKNLYRVQTLIVKWKANFKVSLNELYCIEKISNAFSVMNIFQIQLKLQEAHPVRWHTHFRQFVQTFEISTDFLYLIPQHCNRNNYESDINGRYSSFSTSCLKARFWGHFNSIIENNKCSEDGIWFTDAVSETEVIKIFIALERMLVTMATSVYLLNSASWPSIKITLFS